MGIQQSYSLLRVHRTSFSKPTRSWPLQRLGRQSGRYYCCMWYVQRRPHSDSAYRYNNSSSPSSSDVLIDASVDACDSRRLCPAIWAIGLGNLHSYRIKLCPDPPARVRATDTHVVGIPRAVQLPTSTILLCTAPGAVCCCIQTSTRDCCTGYLVRCIVMPKSDHSHLRSYNKSKPCY